MTLAVLLTAVGLGLRHGLDWDHIAAISDLCGTAETPRRGLVRSSLYALAHAVVVLMLGFLAIVTGTSLPSSVDRLMGGVVGVTLIGLGLWVLVDLIRNGRNFRLRSRWVLLLEGTFAGLRQLHRVRRRDGRRFVSVQHEHPHHHPADSPHHGHGHGHEHEHGSWTLNERVRGGVERDGANHDHHERTHNHRHEHQIALRSTPTPDRLANRSAAGIGVLHGIGIESPTQIAVFVASTAVGGVGAGLLLLFGWVGGLLIGNTALALTASRGLLRASSNFRLYATVSTLLALGSITLGAVYTLGV